MTLSVIFLDCGYFTIHSDPRLGVPEFRLVSGEEVSVSFEPARLV